MELKVVQMQTGVIHKFPDGTLICTLVTQVTDQAINTPYGSLFIGSRTWTYPETFIATPALSCSVFRWGSSASWGSATPQSSTVGGLTGYDYSSRAIGTAVNIEAIAIGRWKGERWRASKDPPDLLCSTEATEA